MREFRHTNEKTVMVNFSRTAVGKRCTVAQVKAAARLVLRAISSKLTYTPTPVDAAA